MQPTIYVTLPPEMVSIRYPGYFYHIKERVLYSLKGGTLKPIRWKKPNKFSYYKVPYVHISHDGKSRTLSQPYLDSVGLRGKHTVVPFKTT